MNSKVIQDSIYQQSHFLATILRITQLSDGMINCLKKSNCKEEPWLLVVDPMATCFCCLGLW